jgi:hypothetical protein
MLPFQNLVCRRWEIWLIGDLGWRAFKVHYWGTADGAADKAAELADGIDFLGAEVELAGSPD